MTPPAAGAFAYPFRGRAPWLAGSLLVLVWPLSFPVLLGYALAAVRASAVDPAAPPPRLAVSRRLVGDGFLFGLALAVLTAPFAIALVPLAQALERARLFPGTGGLEFAYDLLVAGFFLSLVWAVLVLLLLPPNAAAFALSGRARDLFDPIAAGRRVRDAFVAWNVATVVIVTAWLLAAAGACLCCVGFLPTGFYAMLVSAHAAASLAQPKAS